MGGLAKKEERKEHQRTQDAIVEVEVIHFDAVFGAPAHARGLHARPAKFEIALAAAHVLAPTVFLDEKRAPRAAFDVLRHRPCVEAHVITAREPVVRLGTHRAKRFAAFFAVHLSCSPPAWLELVERVAVGTKPSKRVFGLVVLALSHANVQLTVLVCGQVVYRVRTDQSTTPIHGTRQRIVHLAVPAKTVAQKGSDLG
jgi:hypothetical protein